MKAKLIFSVFVLMAYATAAPTQTLTEDTPFKSITLGSKKDITFDKVIDYLQTSDFYIQSVDKQAGFIQATIFLKEKKKLLSAKEGEKRTLNFLIRPTEDGTRVVLSIYSETRYFGGDISSRTYYYEDNGIMDDEVVYREILNNLQINITS